jgi:hypothetical protein
MLIYMRYFFSANFDRPMFTHSVEFRMCAIDVVVTTKGIRFSNPICETLRALCTRLSMDPTKPTKLPFVV